MLKKIKNRLKAKKYAPAPPLNSGPSPGTAAAPSTVQLSANGSVSTEESDSVSGESLEGCMNLRVVLPDGATVTEQVPRRTPMGDLLVQLTKPRKLSPAGHVLTVKGDRESPVPYKPNTAVGSLNASAVHVTVKNTVKRNSSSSKQPFETTFRLRVHLPHGQLHVLRVSANVPLSHVLKAVCEEKGLSEGRYELRHPVCAEERLDYKRSLADYNLTEVAFVAIKSAAPIPVVTSSDIMAMKARKNSDTGSSRGDSPVRSEASSKRSASPGRPPRTGRITTAPKKRLAPPPPPSSRPPPPTHPEKNEAEPVIAATVTHSRHSSDSSGYHEASILSDTTEPNTPLPPPVQTPPVIVNSSSSSSVTSVASVATAKKRPAPCPPKPAPRSNVPARVATPEPRPPTPETIPVREEEEEEKEEVCEPKSRDSVRSTSSEEEEEEEEVVERNSRVTEEENEAIVMTDPVAEDEHDGSLKGFSLGEDEDGEIETRITEREVDDAVVAAADEDETTKDQVATDVADVREDLLTATTTSSEAEGVAPQDAASRRNSTSESLSSETSDSCESGLEVEATATVLVPDEIAALDEPMDGVEVAEPPITWEYQLPEPPPPPVLPDDSPPNPPHIPPPILPEDPVPEEDTPPPVPKDPPPPSPPVIQDRETPRLDADKPKVAATRRGGPLVNFSISSYKSSRAPDIYDEGGVSRGESIAEKTKRFSWGAARQEAPETEQRKGLTAGKEAVKTEEVEEVTAERKVVVEEKVEAVAEKTVETETEAQAKLQEEYEKLQRQMLEWQKQLMRNQAVLRDQNAAPQSARSFERMQELMTSVQNRVTANNDPEDSLRTRSLPRPTANHPQKPSGPGHATLDRKPVRVSINAWNGREAEAVTVQGSFPSNSETKIGTEKAEPPVVKERDPDTEERKAEAVNGGVAMRPKQDAPFAKVTSSAARPASYAGSGNVNRPQPEAMNVMGAFGKTGNKRFTTLVSLMAAQALSEGAPAAQEPRTEAKPSGAARVGSRQQQPTATPPPPPPPPPPPTSTPPERKSSGTETPAAAVSTRKLNITTGNADRGLADQRQQLLSAIGSFGGRSGLRKVSNNEVKSWQLRHGSLDSVA